MDASYPEQHGDSWHVTKLLAIAV